MEGVAGSEERGITLWDVYRTALRLGASLQVELVADANIGTWRSERMLRVSPCLIRGYVAVQQGMTCDWYYFVPAGLAKAAEVRGG
jgi:hypothetical protein